MLSPLVEFGKFCVDQSVDPWNSHTGAGPGIARIELFAQRIYEDLACKNRGREQSRKRGAGSIKKVIASFRWAQNYLGLVMESSEFQLLYALAAKNALELGHLPSRARPIPISAQRSLQRMVCGLGADVTEPDRLFCAAMLLCIHGVCRFSDVQRLYVKDVKNLLEGDSISSYKTKTGAWKDQSFFRCIQERSWNVLGSRRWWR